MYQYLEGKITEVEAGFVVLDVQKVGYLIYTPNPYAFEENKDYKIYIYQQVREDDISLYGFKTKEEKELFLKLINVKGLGCKMALPILATGSINGIVDAIERENILYLKKFPKIGDKLAKQIILDLKGKINMTISSSNIDNSKEELVEVLKNLGYKDKDIKEVVVKVDNTITLEEQVKSALKLLLR